MAAYKYNKYRLELEIFQVDKPRGKWLAIGIHEHLPLGFMCIAYLDKVPDGCSRMNKEEEVYRQMQMEEILAGQGKLLFPIKLKG